MSNIEKRKIRNSLRVEKHNKNNRPVLNIFKSNRNIFVQILGENGVVLVTSTSSSKESKTKLNGKKGIEVASAIGEEIAKKAIEKNIKEIVFNKGPYRYAGRIQALADAARKIGLIF
jgi:large subunit ribosomal protein L18